MLLLNGEYYKTKAMFWKDDGPVEIEVLLLNGYLGWFSCPILV